VTALNPTGDGHVLAGLQTCDGLKMAAILIAIRKSIEKIFDRRKADALQVGCPLRPDAFQVLKRCL
jgi:hypothetical protein